MSFAYRVSHPTKPLPNTVFALMPERDSNALEIDYTESFAPIVKKPVPLPPDPARMLTQSQLCSAVASAAKANDLPIPFFANLIWQESNFDSDVVSRAGAQGIAQFMPQTAVEFGLINPFEPIHALNVAGKFLRELYDQFGNLGLAAAAYNAGPRRVSVWMTKGGALPSETRKYVLKITGRPAHAWKSPEVQNDPEAALMPAKAPCVEVAEAVEEQAKVIRISRLMKELAEATTLASDTQFASKPDTDGVKDAGAKPDWKPRAVRMARADIEHASDDAGKRTATNADKDADRASSKDKAKSAKVKSAKAKSAKAKSATAVASNSTVQSAAQVAAKTPGNGAEKPDAPGVNDSAARKPSKDKSEAATRVAGKRRSKGKLEDGTKIAAKGSTEGTAKSSAKVAAKPQADESPKSEATKHAAMRQRRLKRRTQFAHTGSFKSNW